MDFDQLASDLLAAGFQVLPYPHADRYNLIKWYAYRSVSAGWATLKDDMNPSKGQLLVVYPFLFMLSGQPAPNVEVEIRGTTKGINYQIKAFGLTDDLIERLPFVEANLIAAWNVLA